MLVLGIVLEGQFANRKKSGERTNNYQIFTEKKLFQMSLTLHFDEVKDWYDFI